MNHLVSLLDHVRQLLSRSAGGRSRRSAQPSGERGVADNGASLNRLMLVKIAWTLSFLAFLSGFSGNGDHRAVFERLLNTCAIVDAILACALRERFSSTILSRWDEAIIFVTLSLGFRLFA